MAQEPPKKDSPRPGASTVAAPAARPLAAPAPAQAPVVRPPVSAPAATVSPRSPPVLAPAQPQGVRPPATGVAPRPAQAVGAPAKPQQPAAPAGGKIAGPEFFAQVEAVDQILDTLDYFQLFRLPPTAGAREIKDAYYRESRAYHPDRFHQLPDERLRERINRIFKRVTEAYVVLRDDQKRAKYLADLSGPEREKKLRYSEASEAELKAETKKAVEEQIGTTPKGRECFKNGMKELDGQRFEAALRQFKMALAYEPQNVKYKERLAEAQAAFDKTRPKDDFRIK